MVVSCKDRSNSMSRDSELREDWKDWGREKSVRREQRELDREWLEMKFINREK